MRIVASTMRSDGGRDARMARALEVRYAVRRAPRSRVAGRPPLALRPPRDRHRAAHAHTHTPDRQHTRHVTSTARTRCPRPSQRCSHTDRAERQGGHHLPRSRRREREGTRRQSLATNSKVPSRVSRPEARPLPVAVGSARESRELPPAGGRRAAHALGRTESEQRHDARARASWRRREGGLRPRRSVQRGSAAITRRPTSRRFVVPSCCTASRQTGRAARPPGWRGSRSWGL